MAGREADTDAEDTAMTLTNRLWAIAVSVAGTGFGISVMAGHVPGVHSEIGTFARIAALTELAVAHHGHVPTGLAAIVIGWIVGALCLVGGTGSPDSGLGTD